MKVYFKKSIFQIGLLAKIHKLKNRNKLTVVMFHRVLSVNDPHWKGCDIEWTVTDEVFEQCLYFFKKYYNIVSLMDVLSSYKHGTCLPENPLLITFDDGWADNEKYALPILKKYNMPAVVFIVSDVVDKKESFWEEHIYSAWKTNQLHLDLSCCPIKDLVSSSLKSEKDIRQFIATIGQLPLIAKNSLLKLICEQLPAFSPDAMLTTAQVDCLMSAGIDIGSHGASHTPLLKSENLDTELYSSKEYIVKTILNSEYSTDIDICLSFPHGSYDSTVVKMAFAAGYQLLFTSDPYLVPLKKGKLSKRVLGRISIPQSAIVDQEGNFSAVQLAFWLMNRSAQKLTDN